MSALSTTVVPLLAFMLSGPLETLAGTEQMEILCQTHDLLSLSHHCLGTLEAIVLDILFNSLIRFLAKS